MLKKYIILLFIAFTNTILYSHPEFYLFTTLYNEQRPFRIREYQQCIDKNCNNPLIKEIIVFLQGPAQFDLNHEKITVVHISKRPSYKEFMEYASSQSKYKDKYIIIANGDIYFDQSLEKLDTISWNNLFIALTRHEAILTHLKYPNISFDTWIYKNPIKAYPTDNLKLGNPGHDTRFVYQMMQHNFNVQNPCLDIKTWHLDSVLPNKKTYKKSWAQMKLFETNPETIQANYTVSKSIPFSKLK